MKRLVFVLGMHRSGTSCLTGLLGDAGVWLGPVEVGSPHNAKGNNENRQVMNVNKAVLAHNGCSWFDPPAGDATWTEEHLARADTILADVLADGRVTAMKDPRSLYTGLGWWDRALAAGAQVSAIGTFRRPERVIASLMARNPELGTERCTELWLAYNRRLLALHDQHDFPIVDFDQPPDEYLSAVRRAFAELGLGDDVELTFFEQDLRHQMTDAERPAAQAQVLAELRRRAV